MANATTRSPQTQLGNTAGVVEFAQDPADHSAPTALAAGGATLSVTLKGGWQNKGYAQVVYYNDSAGATEVDPTAGTETVVMVPFLTRSTTVGTATIYDQNDWSGGVLDHAAAAPQGFSWNWPTKTVQVTLAGIAGATHARLRVEVQLA